MKKSLVLTLVVVYVLSICVVGYFGLKVQVYRPTTYPESIEIIEVKDERTGKIVDIKNDKVTGEKYVRLENYTDNCSFIILFRISPDNTTDRKVNVTPSKGRVCNVYQNSNQLISEVQVVFKENDLVTINIVATSKESVGDSITMSFKS